MFLKGVKAELCDRCPSCSAPDSLCIAHSRDFEWMCRLGRANIPVRYWNLEIEETLIPGGTALNFVKSACENVQQVVGRGLGFSVFGNRGRGKTTLTIYFLKEALRHGISGYFSLMESLMNIIRESFENPEQKEKFNRVKNMRVLVLDDLGKEYMTNSGFVVARVDELFRWRDSMGLSTLFSSNLTGSEFKARYGDGIISLLKNTNQTLGLKGDELRPALNEWGDLCQK